jgi:hypothetical protein
MEMTCKHVLYSAEWKALTNYIRSMNTLIPGIHWVTTAILVVRAKTTFCLELLILCTSMYIFYPYFKTNPCLGAIFVNVNPLIPIVNILIIIQASYLCSMTMTLFSLFNNNRSSNLESWNVQKCYAHKNVHLNLKRPWRVPNNEKDLDITS